MADMKQPLALESSILDLFRTVIEVVFWLMALVLVTGLAMLSILGLWIGAVSMCLGLFLLFYTGYIEPGWYQTVVYRLTLRDGLSTPLKIIFLSDFHTGHRKSKARYTRLFQRVQKLQPDLVLLGGDFVESIGATAADLEGLQLLKPPLGMFFILGNHDYWDDPKRVAAILTAFGAQDLTNREIELRVGIERIRLIGADDASFGVPVLPNLWQSGLPTIFLTHEVDLLSDIPEGACDLVLLGHTHGGQIRFPFKGSLAPLPQAAPAWLDQGLKTWRGLRLIISRGIGESMARVRFWARPQIVVVELK